MHGASGRLACIAVRFGCCRFRYSQQLFDRCDTLSGVGDRNSQEALDRMGQRAIDLTLLAFEFTGVQVRIQQRPQRFQLDPEHAAGREQAVRVYCIRACANSEVIERIGIATDKVGDR